MSLVEQTNITKAVLIEKVFPKISSVKRSSRKLEIKLRTAKLSQRMEPSDYFTPISSV